MHDQSKITRRRALQMASAVPGLAAGGARGAQAQAQPQMQPRIERLAPEFDKIISVDEPIKDLASGFGGPLGPAEGPLWWKESGYLLFTDIHNNRRMKYTPGKGVTVDLEPTNRANGLTRDLQGRLLSCEHDTRRVTRRELDGGLTVLANSFQGRRLNRPNDVVVKSDGAIYFTDPWTLQAPQDLPASTGSPRISARSRCSSTISCCPTGLRSRPTRACSTSTTPGVATSAPSM